MLTKLGYFDGKCYHMLPHMAYIRILWEMFQHMVVSTNGSTEGTPSSLAGLVHELFMENPNYK